MEDEDKIEETVEEVMEKPKKKKTPKPAYSSEEIEYRRQALMDKIKRGGK